MNINSNTNVVMGLLFSTTEPTLHRAPPIPSVEPMEKLHTSDKATSNLLNGILQADISDKSGTNAFDRLDHTFTPCHCKRKRSPKLPEKLVHLVNMGKDVVQGKGQTAKRINQHYIVLIHAYCHAYRASKSNDDKRRVARLVMKEVTDKGGRFLDSEGNEMDSKEALKKVMKSLKDVRRTSNPTAGSQIRREDTGYAPSPSQPVHFHRISEEDVCKDVEMEDRHDCTPFDTVAQKEVHGNDFCGPSEAEIFVDHASGEQKTEAQQSDLNGSSSSGLTACLKDEDDYQEWLLRDKKDDSAATLDDSAATLDWLAHGGLMKVSLV